MCNSAKRLSQKKKKQEILRIFEEAPFRWALLRWRPLMVTCFSMTSNRPRDLDMSFGIDCFAPASFLIFSMTHTNSFPRMANFSNWMWIWRSVSDFCCRVFWFDFTDLTRFNFWHHFFYWALFLLRSSSPGFHCPSTFCLLLGTK